jgi:serine phosphatase RsbU (regulator of sigma subunit)
LAYTDGVVEAGDDWPQDPFGEERLRQVLSDSAEFSPEEIVARVFRAVRACTKGSFRDDVTVVVLRSGGGVCPII